MRKLVISLILLAIAVCSVIVISLSRNIPIKKIDYNVYPTITQRPFKRPNSESLFNLINKWRRKNGFGEYIKDSRLCEIAIDRSHDEFDNHAGLLKKWNNFEFKASENLVSIDYQTDITEESTLYNWLQSPPHRQALEKAYTHSCVACGEKQCVQIFSSFER